MKFSAMGSFAGRELVGDIFTGGLVGDTDLELMWSCRFCSLCMTRALGEGRVESESKTTIGEA